MDANVITAISVTATLVLAIAWRIADTRRALPVVFHAYAGVNEALGQVQVQFWLANSGPADAYEVKVIGYGGFTTVTQEWPDGRGGVVDLVPRLASGDTFEKCFLTLDSREWERAELAVTWTTTARWGALLSRRARFVPVARIADLPEDAVGLTPRVSPVEYIGPLARPPRARRWNAGVRLVQRLGARLV